MKPSSDCQRAASFCFLCHAIVGKSEISADRSTLALQAVTTVSYVKTYFNSTNSTRETEYRSGCPADASQIRMDTCEIPDQQHAPNPIGQEGNLTGLTFFFTLHNHMEVNQTLYPGFEGTATSFGVYWYSYAVVLFGAMAGLFGYM